MAGPDDLPTGDLYDEPSEYGALWHAIQTETTDPEVLGILYVVRDGQEEQWTLLDRPIIKFGFCKE